MRRPVLSALVLSALAAPLLASAPAPSHAAVAADAGAAAKKAVVRSVLKETPNGSFKGRLISKKATCERRKDVYIIVADPSTNIPQIQYVATTDATGRWSLQTTRVQGLRRGQAETRLTAFTLGDRDCRIAQSNTVQQSPQRPKKRAAVGVTLTGPQLMTSGGQISSSRDGCRRFRPVFGFFRPVGSDDPFQAQIISISRAGGRWNFGEDGSNPMPRLRGGDTYDVLVAVPGNRLCQPAQSAKRRYAA